MSARWHCAGAPFPGVSGDAGSEVGSAIRHGDPLDGFLSQQVSGHTEESAEHRALQGDLGELQGREVGKVPDLQRTQELAEGAGR